jgi:hypothetical protein
VFPFEAQTASASVGQPLPQRVGTPLQIVQACRTSVVEAAIPYGAVRVDAVSAGRLNRTRDGGLAAPIAVRVTYARAEASQVRQSQIVCRLDASGAVVDLQS